MSDVMKAYLAGGCFWGMEYYLKKLDGVLYTKVGYTGGDLNRATYKDVCTGETNNAEVVEVSYDPFKISYRELVKYFFRIHDPTTLNKQHNDVGTQYRSSIFTSVESEISTIKDIITKINQTDYFESSVVTTIEPLTTFVEAEDYHQQYLEKNPAGYNCHALNSKPLNID
jgi:peptide-methionine (S)-S-oxide reductase